MRVWKAREQVSQATPANPKKPRGLSRAWLYEQLGDLADGRRDMLDEFVIAQGPFDRALTLEEQFDLLDGPVSDEKLDAATTARILEARRDYLRYVVATAADPTTREPGPVRVPTSLLQPLLDQAEAEYDQGAAAFNRRLSEQTKIPPYTIRRIRRGTRKTLTAVEAEVLLVAARYLDIHRIVVGPLLDEHDELQAATASKREALDEELRPELRMLALSNSRREGDWTDAEREALDDWYWMNGTDWPEKVVPLFTRPRERDEILTDLFVRERGREPRPLPKRVRQRALTVVQARQKRERDNLEEAEKAIGNYPINEARVGELTRGARRAGILPAKAKPRGERAPKVPKPRGQSAA